MHGRIAALCGAEGRGFENIASKSIDCMMIYKYNMTTTGGTHTIPRDCDIISDYFLYTKIGVGCVNRIGVISNGCIMFTLTGRAIDILDKMANGDGESIPLPFPSFALCNMQYQRLEWELCLQPDATLLSNQRRRLKLRIDNALRVDSLTDIIIDYLIITDEYRGDVAIYNSSKVISNNARRAMPVSGSRAVKTYCEYTIPMKPGCQYVRVNIDRGVKYLSKIAFVFIIDDEYVPIMIDGELLCQHLKHSVLSPNICHIIDKKISKSHVPREPIYTITFDNCDDIDNPLRESSYIDPVSTAVELKLCIIPQSKPVALFVLCEHINYMVTNGGMVNMRYTN